MQIDETVQGLMKARNDLDDQIGTLRAAKSNIDQRLKAVLLEDAGLERLSFRYGPDIVRVKPKYRTKPKAEAVGDLFEIIADQTEYQGIEVLRRLFNLNQMRWAQFRALIDEVWKENIIDPETGEILRTLSGWRDFAREYLDISDGEVEVQVIPEDRAPKFLVKLKDGEAVPA